MESERKAIRSVTHQVLARQINDLHLARPFAPSCQRPSRQNGTRKSSVPCRLHSVAKEHWLADLRLLPPFAWLAAESNHFKILLAGKLRGRIIRSNQSSGLNNTWLLAPDIPPKIGFTYAAGFSVFFSPAIVLFSLLPAEDTALQECNRSAVWSES